VRVARPSRPFIQIVRSREHVPTTGWTTVWVQVPPRTGRPQQRSEVTPRRAS